MYIVSKMKLGQIDSPVISYVFWVLGGIELIGALIFAIQGFSADNDIAQWTSATLTVSALVSGLLFIAIGTLFKFLNEIKQLIEMTSTVKESKQSD